MQDFSGSGWYVWRFFQQHGANNYWTDDFDTIDSSFAHSSLFINANTLGYAGWSTYAVAANQSGATKPGGTKITFRNNMSYGGDENNSDAAGNGRFWIGFMYGNQAGDMLNKVTASYSNNHTAVSNINAISGINVVFFNGSVHTNSYYGSYIVYQSGTQKASGSCTFYTNNTEQTISLKRTGGSSALNSNGTYTLYLGSTALCNNLSIPNNQSIYYYAASFPIQSYNGVVAGYPGRPDFRISSTNSCNSNHAYNGFTTSYDHDWDNGVVTTPATTTATGVKTYTCKDPNCTVTKTETIPVITCTHPNGFTGTDASKATLKTAATCTSPAVYYKYCTTCLAQGSDTFTSGSALGHDFTKKTESNTYLKSAATCTADAVYYYQCSRCTTSSQNNGNATWTKSNSKLGHSASSTWTDKGTYEAQMCSRNCGTEVNRRIKITYNANTGSGAPGTTYSNSTTETSYSGTLSSTIPTLSGYSFQGWSTTQSEVGSGTAQYQPGGSFSGLTQNTTLYAVWKIENKIVFWFNGGAFNRTPTLNPIGTPYDLPQNDQHGAYTVQYFSDRIEITNFTSSTDIALPLVNYNGSEEFVTRPGFTSVGGWATSDANAKKGTISISSESGTVGTPVVRKFGEGRTDLYAAWSTVVQIKPNGGTVANAGPGGDYYLALYEQDSSGTAWSDSHKYTLGDYSSAYHITMPSTADQFLGYYSAATGGTRFTEINPRVNTSGTAIAPAENVVLHTQWHYRGFTITYYNGTNVVKTQFFPLDAGSTTTASGHVYTETELFGGELPTNWTLYGYVTTPDSPLTGWNTNGTFTDFDGYLPGAPITLTSDINLYAWNYSMNVQLKYNVNAPDAYWDGVNGSDQEDKFNNTPFGTIKTGDAYKYPTETATLAREGYRLHTSLTYLNIPRFYTADGNGHGRNTAANYNNGYGWDTWPDYYGGESNFGLTISATSDDGGATILEGSTMLLYAVWDPIIKYNMNDNSGVVVQDFNYISGKTISSQPGNGNYYRILGVGDDTLYSSSAGDCNGSRGNASINNNHQLLANYEGYNGPVVIPTRSGYQIKEWNTKPDGTGTAYQVGSDYEVLQPLTLYAIWEVAGKTVTLHSGYNGNGHNHSLTVNNGASETLYNDKASVASQYGIAPNSSNPNAVFRGWNTNEHGTGTWYTTLDNTNSNLAVTDLYAMWEYPVIWDANGGTFTGSFAAGSPSTITTYTRIGTNNAAETDSQGKTWTYGQSFLDEGYAHFPTASDLYREGYTPYVLNGTPFLLLYGYHPSATYTTNQVGRIYTEEGANQWFTLNGFNYFYNDHLYPDTNGVITMYAIWLPDITFNANGGSGTMAKQNPGVIDQDDIMLTVAQIKGGATNKAFTTVNGKKVYNPVYTAYYAPSNGFTAPAGMRFAGWNENETAADRGEVQYAAGAQVFAKGYAVDTGAAPKTLYAVWVPDTVTVSFAVNPSGYGTLNDTASITVHKGSTVTVNGNVLTIVDGSSNFTYTATPATDTAQYHYSFASWSGYSATINANTTITANFNRTMQEYTITWKNWDDTTITTTQVAYGTVPAYGGATPTKPEDAGYTYTFNGWDPTLSAVTGNATYTAQFKENPKSFDIIYHFNNTNYSVTEGYYKGRTVSFEAGWINQSSVEETYTYGDTVELPQSVNINCNKCRFLGWYDNAACTGEPIEAITAADHGDKTFYAKWIPYTLFVFGDAFTLKIDNKEIGEFANKQYEPVDVNQKIDLEYKGNKDFCCWVNGTNKLLGTNKSLSVTFYSVSKITAVTHSRDDNQANYKYIAFMSDERQVFKSVYTSEITNAIENELPDGIYTDVTGKDVPTKAGWIFKGWSLTQNAENADAQIISSINSEISKATGIIMVFPVYEKNTSVYTVEVHDNAQTLTKEVAIGEAYGFECITPGFSYWKDGSDNIVSFNPHYVVRKFNSTTYTYTAVYDSEETPRTILCQPECYVTWATKPKKRFSFTTSIAVPEGVSLVEMGILYTTKADVGGSDSAFRLDKSGVSKYKSESPVINPLEDTFLDTGTITLSLVTSNTTGTIYARGYAITKASDGTLIYTYSDPSSIATSTTPVG